MDGEHGAGNSSGRLQGLAGLRVVAFESRRATELAEMIRRHRGTPVSAPALREVPLSENGPALEFARLLREGKLDVVIFLTGIGVSFLADAIEPALPRPDLAAGLSAITTVVRGPKPAKALRDMGVSPTITVPEPNTWRELLAAIDERIPVAGKRIALQEYGEENPELVAALVGRGAAVIRVPVYRWTLPEDLQPLRDAIRQIMDGKIDVALFTSATQVDHLFQVVGPDQAPGLKTAFARVVVASIGPVCSEALKRHGLNVDFEPERPKMGFLIAGIAERADALVRAKRAGG